MFKEESEIWKDVPGFEGAFQVSSFGRVRSLPRIDALGHHYFFSSQKKASEILGLNNGHISACLHGKLKHHHGFSFEWEGDPDD